MTTRVGLPDGSRARELAGDARAGSYARAMARRRQRQFARRHAVRMLSGWLLMVAATPAVWWFLPSEFLRGLFLGVNLATATAVVWSWMVQASGTAPIMMGDQAEQWTAQEIRKLGRQWRLVNHFTLARGDLDHVVAGPAGLVVLETKWSAGAWESEDGRRRQHEAAAQVQRAARQLSHWHELRKSGLPVRTVVVLWGGQPDDGHGVETVRHIGGTVVVSGRSLTGFLRSLPPVVDDHERRAQLAWEALERHARKRDAYDALEVPRSASETLLRLALRVLAFMVGFLLVASTLEGTGSLTGTAAFGSVAASVAAGAACRWPYVRVEAGAFAAGAAATTLTLLVAYLLTHLSL